MELSNRIDYEFLFPLELRDPITDQPVGITMQIRSAGSDAAKQVLRKHTDKNLERLIRQKLPKAAQREREELEKAASYIASWDWGKNTWKGKVPELSMKIAMEVMDEQPWIFAAVTEAANTIENFSPASPKISRDT